jgi:hypothetical protein
LTPDASAHDGLFGEVSALGPTSAKDRGENSII